MQKRSISVTETRSVDYETTLTGGVAAGAVMIFFSWDQARGNPKGR